MRKRRKPRTFFWNVFSNILELSVLKASLNDYYPDTQEKGSGGGGGGGGEGGKREGKKRKKMREWGRNKKK